MSIRAIVNVYIRKHRSVISNELDVFRQQPTLRDAIKRAAFAINSENIRFSHQHRITRSALKQARKILLANVEPIERSKDFDELHSLIDGLLKSTKGIGELYIYDTSLHIGAKLKLLPKTVYLHAGTRTGAKALGISGKNRAIEITTLPSEFQRLEPYEIEDALCIFKHILMEEKIGISH